ncbi:MAG TPA: hypothetical protein VM658_12765 [bacterium]|nr:hypothetical protein [bacterium]
MNLIQSALKFLAPAAPVIALSVIWLASPGCRFEADCEDRGCRGNGRCACLTYDELYARQSEAIANLKAIYQNEVAYYGEMGTYSGSFRGIYWSPEGDTAYAYFLPDETLQPSIAGPYQLPRGLAPAAGADDFAALAVSNIDCDPVLDIFMISKNGFVVSVSNDITE